jgi:sugar transferase EpsL
MFDFVAALALLVGLFPLRFVLFVLVRLRLGTPVFFRQDRPGKNGRIFTIFKFRTLSEERGVDGQLLPDEQRLGGFGRFLRSTSLDELPELVNVLRGEMSLVGPRPLLVRYLDRYSPEQARRHSVLPGITGWAQVRGRNALSWEEKFVLDVWYVDNHSFILDLKILFMTVWKTITREGISQDGHFSAEEFLGSVATGAECKATEELGNS